MGSRLLWRRSTAAAGLYASAALGILATVVAARALGLEEFGRFATVVAAAGFFQVLLDLTVEESLTKYGFRYATAGDWPRFHTLFRRALELKLAGGALASLALLALAPFADALFGADGLGPAFALAAVVPALQAPENVAATALLLRGRYDVRGLFQATSMGLRFVGIAIGAQFGVLEAVLGMVLAQALATALLGSAGWLALRRFPAARPAPLGEDRSELVRFVASSTAATGIISLRGTLTPLLLGIVAGPTQVGLLRVAQAPQTGFYAASSPVRLIMLTEQTRDWERGDRGGVLAGVRRYALAAVGLMVVALPVFMVLMPWLIEVVFGSDYLQATTAARIVLVAAALQLVFGWTKSLPVTIGRPRLRLVTHGVEALVLLPLVVAFGAAWGVTGAAVAILVSTIVFVSLWSALALRLRREVDGVLPRAEVTAS